MTTTRIALVSSLVVLLGGCASGGPRMHFWPFGTTVKCTQSPCKVEVEVKAKAGGGCEAKVDADTLKIEIPLGKPVRIDWKIRGEKGEFANRPHGADGVDFKGNGKFKGRAHAGKHFKWDFDNDVKQPEPGHKYDVNTTLDGKPCDLLDPYVMN
jgi:hypothetical protein